MANSSKDFIEKENLEKELRDSETHFNSWKNSVFSQRKRISRNKVLFRSLIVIGILAIISTIILFLFEVDMLVGAVHINENIAYSLLYVGLSLAGFSAIILQIYESEKNSLNEYRRQIMFGDIKGFFHRYHTLNEMAALLAFEEVFKEYKTPENLQTMSKHTQAAFSSGLLTISQMQRLFRQKIKNSKDDLERRRYKDAQQMFESLMNKHYESQRKKLEK